METNGMNNPNEELKCPEKLVAGLRAVAEPKIFVPPTLDESILKAAQKHLEKGSVIKPGFGWSILFRMLATAAVTILAIVAIIRWEHRTRRPSNTPALLAVTDVNGDGRVDILDAFALARSLKAGIATDRRLDLNHDGRVDEQDVRVLAGQAVRLDKAPRS